MLNDAREEGSLLFLLFIALLFQDNRKLWKRNISWIPWLCYCTLHPLFLIQGSPCRFNQNRVTTSELQEYRLLPWKSLCFLSHFNETFNNSPDFYNKALVTIGWVIATGLWRWTWTCISLISVQHLNYSTIVHLVWAPVVYQFPQLITESSY